MTPAAEIRARWPRVGGIVALAVPGLLGFTAVFGLLRTLLVGGVALLLGALIGWASALRRMSAVSTAALTVGATLLTAGPLALPDTTVAGVVPTLDTLRGLAIGVVRSWRDLLTTVVPTGPVGDVLLVPYLTCLLAGVLGVVLALRASRPAWALFPPAVVLVVSVLMGTDEPVSPLLTGALFGALAIVWVAATARGRAAPGVSRGVAGLALLAVAAGVAAFAGPTVTASGADRYVLRERIEPPFDVRAYPSPLNGFRKYVKDAADSELFTVRGAPQGSRLRLATMDAYDGTVWNVAGGVTGDGGSSGSFRRLGLDDGGEPADVVIDVELREMSTVWMPGLGDVRAVTFTGPRADELADAFRYNEATSTGVVPGGLRAGDGYQLRADLADEPEVGVLDGRAAAPLVQPQLQDVPPVVTSVAADAVAEAQSAYQRAQAVADELRTTGYFSDGLADQATSRAGHGAGRLTDLLGSRVWIGNEEQYAAAAGLMARQVGLPARVVMGFEVPGSSSEEVVITGSQVTAWIEVAFDGVGWVPFPVTPDESRIPPEQAPQPAPEPKPETQQPPPPVEQPPPPLPATGNDEALQESEDGPAGWLGVLLAVALWVGVPLLVLAVPCLAVLGLKARRSRIRRRTGPTEHRVAAGWSEVLDGHRDHGAALPRSGTRREIAGVLGRPGTTELAHRADAAVFAGGTVTDDEAVEFWGLVDRELAELSAGSTWARWRARLSLRSLRRRAS